MSLITRCPACETHFRVVPDQLRISDGWVRCGQCDEIFDASYQLLPVAPTESTLDMTALAPLDNVAAPEVIDVAPLPVDVEVDLDLALALDHKTEELPEEASHATLPANEAPEPLITIAPNPVADLLLHEPEPALPLPAEAAMSEPEAAPDTVLDDDSPARHAELADVAFLRLHKPQAPNRSPRQRAALLGLGFVLLVSLFVQVLVHERDRLVARAPGLQPLLQALCRPLACTLSPLRQLDSIVVESASLTKLYDNTYRLNFTVKNTAATALAVPAVELTLTDLLDQPVVRRVFLASEIGVKLAEMAAGAEWPASILMEISAATEPVAGYRVLAFYP